ncbi:MAG: helix-turn-helix domain-containing protein, partial [Candidatus Nanohaloarchaea archaeon]
MIKRKRRRAGVSQKKVADRAGLSPAHVNRIENNTTNPS